MSGVNYTIVSYQCNNSQPLSFVFQPHFLNGSYIECFWIFHIYFRIREMCRRHWWVSGHVRGHSGTFDYPVFVTRREAKEND